MFGPREDGMPPSGLVHDRIGEQPVEVGFESSQSVAVGEQGDSVVRVDDEGENPEGSPSAAAEGVLDEEVDGGGGGGVAHTSNKVHHFLFTVNKK